QADGAILVVSSGSSTYDLVAKAIEALDKVRGRTLGVVLNRVPLTGAGATKYAYSYHPHESSTGDAGTPVPSNSNHVRTSRRPGGGTVRTGRRPRPRPTATDQTTNADAALEQLFDDATIDPAATDSGGRRG